MSKDRPLQRLRIRQNLSLREAAERIGMNSSNLSEIETGKIRRPHPRTIRRLAAGYGVKEATIQRLLGVRP